MGFAENRKPTADPRSADHESDRGRHADKPSDVPTKGWLDILARTGRRISADNISIVAAGVGFYAFVAVVPALAAIIGIYGLISNPADVSSHVTAFAKILPHEVLPLIEDQLKRITSNVAQASVSTIVGLLVALYSSASATKALIQGLNICYDEQERRNFFRLNFVAIVLTFGAVISAIVAIVLVAGVPPLLEYLRLGDRVNLIVNGLRWLVLVFGFVFGLAVVYRYGPSRNDAKWRWVSWGATAAALLWLAGSALFSLYVAKLGSYDKTYGSLGAVVVFLMWLFISAFSILVGAELNAEMERQTVKDTTEGNQKPLGERGARAADTVGPARDEMPDKEKSAGSRGAQAGEDEKARPPGGARRAE
jgi:membrane protein